MAITYNAGTNIITVTGYTGGTPCNFTDIYNADVAGGWGKVTRQCTNQFCFSARIAIGNGSTATWFTDSLKLILFTAASVSTTGQYLLDVKSNANFRIGVCSSDADKTTEDGVSIIYLGTINNTILRSTTVQIEIYSSNLASLNAEGFVIASTGSKMYNTVLSKGIYLFQAAGVFHNIVLQHAEYGMRDPTVESGSEKIRIEHCNHGIRLGATTTLKNTVIKQSILVDVRVFFSSANHYFINVNCNWSFSWFISAGATVYRQYEFDLKVVDKDNVAIQTATVKIWDKDSNLIVDTTTDVNGVITTQTITRGYYNAANGNTLQEASPHLIKIEKAGYTTYEADFTLEEKTDWLIALQTGGGDGGILRNPPMTGGMV